MVLYNIYSEAIERSYRAHICSFATLFRIAIWLITYVTPVFIAYYTVGFWLVEDFFREQADVAYKHEFILLIQGRDPISMLGYSTYPKFNFILADSLRIPTIASAEYDNNGDGRKDYLSVTISVPLAMDEAVHKVQLLLFFKYRLHRYLNVVMQALANIQHDSSTPGFHFHVEGDLKLNQKIRLPNVGSFLKFDKPIFNTSSDALQSWDLSSVLAEYSSRNLSTDFIGRYPVWRSGNTLGKPFLMNMKIFYPEELIFYQPGYLQMLKFAWMQYLAVLFVFVVVFRELKRFVYTNRLVRTWTAKLHVE